MKDTSVTMRGTEVLHHHKALSGRGRKDGEHSLEVLERRTRGSGLISSLCTSIDKLS